jgi:hypothetical protein
LPTADPPVDKIVGRTPGRTPRSAAGPLAGLSGAVSFLLLGARLLSIEYTSLPGHFLWGRLVTCGPIVGRPLGRVQPGIARPPADEPEARLKSKIPRPREFRTKHSPGAEPICRAHWQTHFQNFLDPMCRGANRFGCFHPHLSHLLSSENRSYPTLN